MKLGKFIFGLPPSTNWQRLLEPDSFKPVIIDSLKYLSEKEKIEVFAFVIMPNHIHLIWRVNELNGKETDPGSFLKFTAHEFKKMLSNEGPSELANYHVSESNKSYEFWQRDSLAVHLYSRDAAYQKLNYIHNNLCLNAGNWPQAHATIHFLQQDSMSWDLMISVL